MNTYRQFGVNQLNQAKSAEKLSSGYKINRSADDAAGLAISGKMRAQINGLTRGVLNIQDGISVLQAAEGALQEIHSILGRIRELAVQGANDSNSPDDRMIIQNEIELLCVGLDKIADSTNFNGKYILRGDHAPDPEELNNSYRNVSHDDHVIKRRRPWEEVNAGFDGAIFVQAGANTLWNSLIAVQILGMNTSNLLNIDDKRSGIWDAAAVYGEDGSLLPTIS